MLVNVHEYGCFSNFGRVDDVTRAMSKGGAVLVVICVKFRANQPLCPPPNQSVPMGPLYPRSRVATNHNLYCLPSVVVFLSYFHHHVHPTE